jgi:hypothetical protein
LHVAGVIYELRCGIRWSRVCCHYIPTETGEAQQRHDGADRPTKEDATASTAFLPPLSPPDVLELGDARLAVPCSRDPLVIKRWELFAHSPPASAAYSPNFDHMLRARHVTAFVRHPSVPVAALMTPGEHL